jgi:hypothetical protein
MTQPQIGSPEVSRNEHINRDAEIRFHLKVFFAVLSQTCARVADFKVLCVQPKKQTSIGTCLLPTWQVGIELQLLSDGKPDVIFVHSQTDRKRGAKAPTLQVPWSSRVGFYSVSFLPFFITSFAYFSSYFPSLPSFPHFYLFPFPLFIYLLIYCEKQLLASSRLSVRSSAWNNTAPTRLIFMKFNVWVFFAKSVKTIHVSLQSEKTTDTLAEDKRHTSWRQQTH